MEGSNHDSMDSETPWTPMTGEGIVDPHAPTARPGHTPTGGPPPTNPTASEALGAPVRAASACGFQIQRILGSGGMASVFLATDLKLSRPVALKFPRFSSDTQPESLQLLKKEAENAARLQHENIVQVYSWNEAEGQLFFAMEFVEGESLSQLLKSSGPMAPEEALRIIYACSEGLEIAHREGILHHDIKPGNIMIRKDGRIKLADLGISTTTDERLRLAQTPVIRGTLGFMAPEQARGQAAIPASEVFSLGVTLYHMLANGSPWNFPVGAPRTVKMKINQVGKTVPITAYRRDLPQSVIKLLEKMLQPAPSARHPDMRSLRKHIEKVFLALDRPARGVFDWLGQRTISTLSFLQPMILFAAGAAAGATYVIWSHSTTHIPKRELNRAGADILRTLAQEATEAYQQRPSDGALGTAVAPIVKASQTGDWPLALRSIGLLHDAGVLKVRLPDSERVVERAPFATTSAPQPKSSQLPISPARERP